MFEKKGSIEIADYVYKPSYKNYRDMDVIICIEHEGYWNEEKYLEFRFSRKQTYDGVDIKRSYNLMSERLQREGFIE